MITSKNRIRKRRKSTAHIWGELADLCRKIHVRLYRRTPDKRSARGYQRRLEQIMTQLPKEDLAIVRQEGAALLSELKGDLDSAIEHRKKEIELTQRAQKSVQESVKRGDYGEETAAWALQGRGPKELEERRAILRDLEEQRDTHQQRDGVSTARPKSGKSRRQRSTRNHFTR
jgi:hypothetical protein